MVDVFITTIATVFPRMLFAPDLGSHYFVCRAPTHAAILQGRAQISEQQQTPFLSDPCQGLEPKVGFLMLILQGHPEVSLAVSLFS